MARIFPFHAYRYSEKAGPLGNLITQPYDKITPQMRTRYLALSPYNLVRVILGERFDADNDTDNVYTRAASHFADWTKSGVLAQEPAPALFTYVQRFRVPDTGEELERQGFIGLGAVEDYSEGVVHRHEHTLSGPKKDRLELLRHVHAHFGQIFMLYPDPKGEIDALLAKTAQAPPLAEVTDELGTENRLWKITDPAQIEAIRAAMASKKLLIADGHHRYETALAFRNENPQLEDAGKVMMTFVNMHSPGLRILATHRLVNGIDAGRLLNTAGTAFKVIDCGTPADLRRVWDRPEPGKIRVGVAVAGSDRIRLIERERASGELDVEFLHKRILDEVLGIGEDAVRNEKNLRYMRGADAAIEEVRRGNAQAAFLIEPASIEDVARIAFSGGVMPQKSTDFYPKLLSGLTIYKLEN